jgi:putative Ca2+/H+ antiporter (TMEM165/GDT1 family)
VGALGLAVRAAENDCSGNDNTQNTQETTMPQGLKILLSTFALLFVAELGDKTQLAVISMTVRHKAPLWIFVGAALALAAVTAIGVLGGQLLTRFVPEAVLHKLAAVLFLVMGVLMWFDKL